MNRLQITLAVLVAATLPAIAIAQAPAAPAKADGTSGCERMKSHMDDMAGHMKRMAEGRGGHCGHHAKDKGKDSRGHCMKRMGEMMKDLAPIADHCDKMTPDMKKHMERHEKEMAKWKEEGPGRK